MTSEDYKRSFKNQSKEIHHGGNNSASSLCGHSEVVGGQVKVRGKTGSPYVLVAPRIEQVSGVGRGCFIQFSKLARLSQKELDFSLSPFPWISTPTPPRSSKMFLKLQEIDSKFKK